MKHIYILILGIFLSITLFSQNITITDSHGAVINNTTVTFSSTDLYSTVYAVGIDVNNNTSNALNLYCKKIEISCVPGTENSFCWGGNCWPSTQYVSGAYTSIPAGGLSSEFAGDYNPFGFGGMSIITYRFFNSTDSAEFTIAYDLPLGINFTINKGTTLSAFPNPANNYITLTFDNKNNSKASFFIYDCLGNVVQKINTNSSTAIVNTSNLPSGLYFYSLITNNKKVYTKKLIINH